MTTCDWSTPGADRFTGDVSAWVQRAYAADIPHPVLVELADRIRRHAYTDRIVITADSVTGARQYDAVISNMGFGAGRKCATVTRARLAAPQGALVYTVQGYSIGIAAVCGNPFMLVERPEQSASIAPTSGGGGSYVPLTFAEAVAVEPVAVVGDVVPPAPAYSPGWAMPVTGWTYGPVVGGWIAPLPPVACVPELSTTIYLLLGAAVFVGLVISSSRPK